MLEIDGKLVQLLKKGTTLTSLQSKMGLYGAEVVKKIHSLEDRGYLIHKQFYDFGVKYIILPEPVKELQDNVEILTNDSFTFIAIGDTHYNNIYENPNLVNCVYQYAESKKIRYILHVGDMTEGIALPAHNADRIKRFDVHEQMDFIASNYPKSEKIETLYILGNHDQRCMNEGIDISRVLEKKRLDMHFLGYKNSKLKIGNRNILMHHPFSMNRDKKYDDEIKDLYMDPEFDIVLRGHTHHSGIYINEMGSIVLNIPACYSSPSRKYNGIYQVTLKENEVKIENLIVDNEVHLFNVIKYPLSEKEKTKTKKLS